MTHRNFLKILSIAAIFFILPLASLIPSAQAAYNFTTVHVSGADGTKAHDINDAGMVVGHFFSPTTTTWHGFTFDGTTYTSYEMPGAGATRFTGINDTGLITGEYYAEGTDWSGFIYDGITWTSLVVPNAARTDPRGINDSGHVAGWNRGPSYCAGYGFLYDGSSFTTIEYPGTDESACSGGPGPLDETRVLDINNAGKLVGFYVIDNALHGFTYEGGTYNTFDYPAWPDSYARGINDVGQIVGAYDDNGTWKSYVNDNGTWSEIFITGSTYTIATGINNNGVITGYYNDGTREYGFIATPSNPTSHKINLPQTGQTTSYLSGDDGDIMAGIAWPATGNSPSGRFNCDADTCTDLLTGLTWLRDANCIATHYPGDDIEDATGDGKVSWFTGRDFIINVNNGSRANCAAGENDWRMPNINELHSLLNYGATDMAGWLSSEGFQNVQSDNYWVSTAYLTMTSLGWAVRIASNSFDIIYENAGQWGGSRGGHSSLPNWNRDLYPPDCYNCSFPYIWLVRGGPDDIPDAAYPANLPETGQKTSGYSGDDGDLEWGISWPVSGNSASGRFSDNANNTMTDLLTGLIWTKSGNVAYPEKIKSFQGALDYIADMNNGTNLSGLCATPCSNFGYTDWKLPNVVELRSLLNFEFECQGLPIECNTSPFYGGGAIGTYLNWEGFTQITDATSEPRITTAGYWSSTTDTSNTDRAYTVAFGFQGGVMGTFDKTSTCVTPGVYPCPSWGPNPSGWFFWPVRAAAAPSTESDISVTPSTYDFGDVVQGTDSDVTFTINNIGNSDLSIVSIAQNDTIYLPFSLVSGQDNCSGTIVAPSASCTFDVRFSPIGRGGYNDTFDIESNDPDTNMLIMSVTAIGTTAFITELPQTGQTMPYSSEDDGDLQMGVAWPATGNMGSGRFNDNGDSTVTDLLTGLMWTKDANIILPLVGTPTYVNLNNYINNTFNVSGGGYAGYADWRIPNMLELESLTNYGQANSATWLSSEGFTNVQAAEYWVSNLYADANNGGWALNLGTHTTTFWHTRGSGGATNKYVWTVRGGANGTPGGFPAEVRKTGQTSEILPRDDGALEWGVTAWDAGRFTDNADGTMTDNLTGLMWTKDGSMVSTLTGIDNMGITDWEKALDVVDYMNAGQSFCSSTIEPCTVDGDCSATAGYCTKNPYNRCDDDTGCGAGSCATIQNRCENNPAVTCTKHSDCGGGNGAPYCRTGKRCSGDTAVICTKDSHCTAVGAGTCTVAPSCFDDTACIDSNVDECKNVEGCLADGGETCLPAPPNYGYDDWYLPNFKEVYSLTHWETERADDDLVAYGFMNVGGPPGWITGRGCGIWTSTTDPSDSMQLFSTAFGWGGNAIKKYPKDTAGTNFCGVNTQNPYIVWPVRIAPAPALVPDISITPISYDFGNVVVGVTSNTVFTVENLGSGDLDITSVSIPSSDFSVQSENCILLSPLSQNATCSISVDFIPSAESIMAEDLSVTSNDPDTPALTAALTGTGIPAFIDLSLDKTAYNSTPFVGDTLTFTVAVTNNGPADATGVSVEDVVPDGYSNIQNISNGGTETAGTITWSGLNINNGVTRDLTYTVQVHASGNYTNVAQVIAADQLDSDSVPDNDDGNQSEDDEDNESVVPVFGIDLELDKSVDNILPDSGSTVTFTVALTNNGYLDATGISVQDMVPDGYSNIQNISHGGTEAGGTITWSGLNVNMGSVDWFDTAWSYRQKITINSSQVSGDLSNFPVLISTTDANLIVSPGGNVGKANGGDILFTNSNGTQKFNHEIESYNSATGELVAWVNIPNVSSTTDTIIYMYYGNAGAADQWNTNGTWNVDYRSVWHLKEDPSGSAPQILDSTSKSNDGTSGGGMTSGDQVHGIMANGSLDFDGIDDEVSVPLDVSLQPSNEITVSAWIKTPDGGVSSGIVDTFRWGPKKGFLIETGDSGTGGDVYWSIGGDNAVATTYFAGPLTDNNWHHVTGTFNGNNGNGYMKLYVDGVLRVTNNSILVYGSAFPSALQYPAVNLSIGVYDSSYNFSGLIDEVRISGIERSADWISTSYNNLSAPASFLNIDAEEVFTQASSTNLTFEADVNASGNYLNVAQVTAADQIDSDSSPNNDNGDQSEDDEDNAIVTPIPSGCTLLRIRNFDTSAEFCTIQEAYIAAGNNQTLHVQAYSFTETLDFNIDKSVTIEGGYDNSYSTADGKTTIIGNLTTSNGTVIIGNIILEQ